MRSAGAVLVSIVLTAGSLAGQAPASKALQVYVIDTEGGKATLYLAPGGQTVLVDSGNPGGRDTDRIMAALSDAGATKIDYLVSTHYHVDHVGGLQELAGRIPIGTFVDHGATVEGPVTALREQVPGFQAAYAELHARAKHLVVKAGDRLPVPGLDWRIVSSAGEVLKTPLPGAGRPNPACAGFENAIDAATWRDPEDGQSVGSLVTLGQFRMIDLADLLWDKAVAMMCPKNTIGTVDLYLVTGHGADVCSADPLVHTLHPRAAVMYNGTRKGGGATAMQGVWRSPGLEDFWQLHWSYNGGLELNSPGLFIANVDDAAAIAGILTAPPRGGGRGAAPPAAMATPPTAPPAAAAPAPAAATAPAAAQPGTPAATAPVPQGRGRGGAAAHPPAYWIKISAQPDGTFTVANSRNGFSKTYATRAK
jgi:beta-lactamase superfamily II metal-dependent hydrolase